MLLTALHAGPFWRDEVNSINVAQSTVPHHFWRSLQSDSFPVLCLLLRCWCWCAAGNGSLWQFCWARAPLNYYENLPLARFSPCPH